MYHIVLLYKYDSEIIYSIKIQDTFITVKPAMRGHLSCGDTF